MPRGKLSPALVQRQTLQTVAVQTRETAGAVATVVAVAETIDGAVDGGLVATLNTKIVEIQDRLVALETP